MNALIPAAANLPAATADALARHAYAARGALADNTMRALRSDTAIFAAWCSSVGTAALPAAADTVAAFIDATDKAPATLRRYVASIAHMHRAAELPDPTKTEAVKLALRRISRSKGVRQRQVTGITKAVAALMVDALPDSMKGLRDRALLLVARDLLARRSELVALDVGDIEFGDDGTATVAIRRSKTDQEGQGAIRLLGPGATAAVRSWLRVYVAEISDSDEMPLFVALSRAGKPGVRLDAGDVARIFKSMAKHAKLENVDTISGHSARIGMACDLVAAGLDIVAIMQAGRWATPAMPARYTERLEVRRGAIARLYGLV